MHQVRVHFVGGELSGEQRSLAQTADLEPLGYRVALAAKARGDDQVPIIAVPQAFTPKQAHEAITAHIGADVDRPRGKRSV